MELLDNKIFQGQFMGASDSLVLFKTELDGGKILTGNRINQKFSIRIRLICYCNNVFKKIHYNRKTKIIVKESKIKQILSFINIFKFIKIIIVFLMNLTFYLYFNFK